MSVYLAYATSGKEFEVADKLASLGFTVWCGRRIDCVRKGNSRWPQPVERPFFPNYLIIDMQPEHWLDLWLLREDGRLKHLAPTMHQLTQKEITGGDPGGKDPNRRGLIHVKEDVDKEYAKGVALAEKWRRLQEMDEARRAEKEAIEERRKYLAEVSKYREGQKLLDLTGTFGDGLLKFRRIVERANEAEPVIEADLEIFGRTTRVTLDPLRTRAAE
jgi:transcription antitermination factor NusG